MGNGGRVAAVIGLGLLGACAQGIDDPLAVNSIYQGLTPNPVYRGELPRVLNSDDETPANQGLLYTSMFESEVAAQYAGLAAAAARPSEARSELGQVLYAIDPDTAPDWEAKSAGIVSGWAGAGYGARRATGEMATAIREALASDGSAALKQSAPGAATCADNTLHRLDQVATLSSQALDEATLPEASLQQIQDVAQQLLRGSDTGADPATCGLEEARRNLAPLALPTRNGG